MEPNVEPERTGKHYAINMSEEDAEKVVAGLYSLLDRAEEAVIPGTRAADYNRRGQVRMKEGNMMADAIPEEVGLVQHIQSEANAGKCIEEIVAPWVQNAVQLRIRDVYRQKSEQDAARALPEVVNSLTSSLPPDYHEVPGVMERIHGSAQDIVTTVAENRYDQELYQDVSFISDWVMVELGYVIDKAFQRKDDQPDS